MKNLLPPLWIKFPHISAFSIGWRMGYGEDYKVKFNDWFKALSEDKRREYMRLFPEPATWRGYWDDAAGEDESALITNGDDFLIDIWEREPRYDLKWLKKRYGAGKAGKFLLFLGPSKRSPDRRKLPKPVVSVRIYREREIRLRRAIHDG